MTGERIEPLNDSRWPRCGQTITGLFDVPLTCVLPAHHERDGSTAHRTEDGTQWTRITDDG